MHSNQMGELIMNLDFDYEPKCMNQKSNSIEFDLQKDCDWKNDPVLLEPIDRQYRVKYMHTMCHVSAFTTNTLLEMRSKMDKIIGAKFFPLVISKEMKLKDVLNNSGSFYVYDPKNIFSEVVFITNRKAFFASGNNRGSEIVGDSLEVDVKTLHCVVINGTVIKDTDVERVSF